LSSTKQKKSSLCDVTILDGGFGREIETRGFSIEAPLWSANIFYDNPDLVRQIHGDFIQAGAEIITTNTYAITEYNLSKAGKANDQLKLLEMAYELAKKAKVESQNSDLLIAASLPPLTESYRADLVDLTILKKEYTTLIEFAAKQQIDILLGETLATFVEAETILQIAKNTNLPVFISFTVDQDGNLRSGQSLREASLKALSLGAEAVMVNCSQIQRIDKSIEIFESMAKEQNFIYGAYPNRFNQIRKDFTLESGLNTIDQELSPEAYQKYAQKWINKGAKIIGGCCGIGPDYLEFLTKESVFKFD
jgi:S-methylmethionine-dependent homocysteine/selenocysteine methylase